MPPVVAAAAIAAGATIVGSEMHRRTQKGAMRLEDRSNQAALAAAREEQAYARRTAEEDRAYRRQMDERDQSRYADERDYGRRQYANYLGRLQPFRQAGNQATANLSAVTTRALPGSVPTMGRGPMVKLQAPNGMVRDVPASQAEWYISRGATKVG